MAQENQTINLRGCDPAVVRAAKREAGARGQSLKQFVLEAIRKAVKK